MKYRYLKEISEILRYKELLRNLVATDIKVRYKRSMLGFIWWRLRNAGIATRPLVALGFAWLACLPLSVNALRKAGLAFDISVDARHAIRFLPAGERQRARDDLAAQVAEAMHELEESDQRHRRLAELCRQLTPEADSGRL